MCNNFFKRSILTLYIPFSLILPLTLFSISTPNVNDNTSKSFVQIGKKAIPAVVFIKVTIGDNREATEYPFDQFTDEFFRHFFGAPPNQFGGHPPCRMASGSGFIVTADGYIMTNDHVVRDANKITVITNNGDEYTAKLVGRDSATDLALLKIEGQNFPFLNFGNSDELEVGEWAIAIGSPFELQSTLTVGVISAKGRQNLDLNKLEDFLQTDAAINPGNSGGPLLNIQGEVIGINAAIMSQTGGYIGLGFAIPSKIAKHAMDQLLSNGTVSRGYLGVILQPIDKEMAEAFNLEKSEGALIAEVTKNSPAEKGGLKQGDIIIQVNGKPIKNFSQLRNNIALMDPGEVVKFKIIRNSKETELTIALGSAPEKADNTHAEGLGLDVSEIKSLAPEILNKWGLNINSEGIVITSVKPGSLGEKAGLKVGMQLIQVNHQRVNNIDDFQMLMKESANKKLILLLIRYQNMTRFISIRLK
jgi:serine protease Do